MCKLCSTGRVKCTQTKKKTCGLMITMTSLKQMKPDLISTAFYKDKFNVCLTAGKVFQI